MEEIDILSEKYIPPRLNQEETENMKRLITSTEIESMIKNLPTNKSPGPDGFTGEFHQIFRKVLFSKTEPVRNRKSEQTKHRHGN